MSKSIHTTRRKVSKVRRFSLGSAEYKDAALEPLYDELTEKRYLKRNEKHRRAVNKVGVPIYVHSHIPRHEDSSRPHVAITPVTAEECGRALSDKEEK